MQFSVLYKESANDSWYGTKKSKLLADALFKEDLRRSNRVSMKDVDLIEYTPSYLMMS